MAPNFRLLYERMSEENKELKRKNSLLEKIIEIHEEKDQIYKEYEEKTNEIVRQMSGEMQKLTDGYESALTDLATNLVNHFSEYEKSPWRIEKKVLECKYSFRNQTVPDGGIVFAGSSLMEMFPLEDWVQELPEPRPMVYNRGIGGYTTEDYLPILDICVWDLKPSKVFINIGTNDLSNPDQTLDEIMERYDEILTRIEEHLPGVPIYVMAYYPVNPEAAPDEQTRAWLSIRTNEKINAANEKVKELAEKHLQRFIDLNAPLKDAEGRLKAEYTIEGVHLNEQGYRSIFDDLMKYALEEIPVAEESNEG